MFNDFPVYSSFALVCGIWMVFQELKGTGLQFEKVILTEVLYLDGFVFVVDIIDCRMLDRLFWHFDVTKSELYLDCCAQRACRIWFRWCHSVVRTFFVDLITKFPFSSIV